MAVRAGVGVYSLSAVEHLLFNLDLYTITGVDIQYTWLKKIQMYHHYVFSEVLNIELKLNQGIVFKIGERKSFHPQAFFFLPDTNKVHQ